MTMLKTLDALTEWLRLNNVEEARVQSYVLRWGNLGPLESIPCPSCFVRISEPHPEQPLAPVRTTDKSQFLLCVHCETTFLVPLATEK